MVLSIHHPRYIKLRQHLKQMRKSAGLSQVTIAEKLGSDQSYVSKIERGERYPIKQSKSLLQKQMKNKG